MHNLMNISGMHLFYVLSQRRGPVRGGGHGPLYALESTAENYGRKIRVEPKFPVCEE